jgi:hypothetical protein
MELTIDTKTKQIHIYVDKTTKQYLHHTCKRFEQLDMYEIFVHNPGQKESLLDEYLHNINIDNLGNDR